MADGAHVLWQTIRLEFVALERSLSETDRCVMPVRKAREVPQVRLYGVTSSYCKKRAGRLRSHEQWYRCWQSAPSENLGCLLLLLLTWFTLIIGGEKLRVLDQRFVVGGAEERPMWPCKVRSAITVVQFLRKGSAITGLRDVARSHKLTLSLSCVVSYPTLDDTKQPKAPADTVAINIDIFLNKKATRL